MAVMSGVSSYGELVPAQLMLGRSCDQAIHKWKKKQRGAR